MSLGKLPGMKGLASGSQGKRRFKSELSVDMISPPLGDFRHTMHVGRGGDVFGDTSFLSNYGGTREPGSPDSATSTKTTGFFTRTFRQARKNSVLRPRTGSREMSSPPPDISPIIKNAISLPQLNIDSPNGSLQRVLLPSSISTTDDSLCTYGLHSGFVTLPRLSRLDRQFHDGDQREPQSESGGVTLTRSDSLTSFTVDLGPSLMTELLCLIDKPSSLHMSNNSQTAGEDHEEDDEDSSLTETPVQSPGVTSPNPSTGGGSFRGIINSRGRPCSTDLAEQEEQRGSQRTPDMTEPAMEAERFQQAADVLSRHYGGGSFTMRTKTTNNITSPAHTHSHKTPYAFSEEEEEVRV